MTIMIPFLIGLAFMMFLMIKTKAGPLVSMLLAALLIGMTCGLTGLETINAITTGFGNTCKGIGIVIIFGTILGEYLEKSNATQRIATTMLKLSGEKNADLALTATGYLVSIPVFVDVALIMIAPLCKAIAKKSKKLVGPLAVALSGALLCTNTFVAPTPAPLSIVGILGIDVGQSILYGLLVAAIGSIAVWAFARFYLSKKPESWYSYLSTAILEEDATPEADEKDMPGFLRSISPILVPVMLILLNTTCSMLLPEGSPVLEITKFIGNSNIALALGTIWAVVMLFKHLPAGESFDAVNNAMKACGPVIFITAAGGSLARVINETGVGELLADFLVASPLPAILVPFLICGFSKFAQGSASVAVIMAATLTLPLTTAGAIHPIIAFLAICAGSQLGSHVNNSFFWVFANLFGYDTKTAMKTLVVGQHIIAFVTLAATFVLSFVLPPL